MKAPELLVSQYEYMNMKVFQFDRFQRVYSIKNLEKSEKNEHEGKQASRGFGENIPEI